MVFLCLYGGKAPYALKGQKLLAQGNTLGRRDGGLCALKGQKHYIYRIFFSFWQILAGEFFDPPRRSGIFFDPPRPSLAREGSTSLPQAPSLLRSEGDVTAPARCSEPS